MSTFTSRVSLYLLLIALVSAAIPHKVFAQTNATNPGPQGVGCIIAATGCGSIANPGLAYDGILTTAASLTAPAAANVVSKVFLQVGFALPVSSGTNVTVRFGFPTQAALVIALQGLIKISTYSANGVATGQTETPNLSGATANTYIDFNFLAASNFQYVELSASNTLSVGSYMVYFYNVATTTNTTTGTTTSPATAGPLPVELVTFSGKSQAAAVELNWVTASEKNSAYFVVERATEAQSQFKRLGEVAGAGNSTHVTNYSFVDAQPIGLGYYRLRQVDLDGTSTYSPVVAMRSTLAPVLLAYPNPSTGLLTVAGPPHTRFTIVNRLGQVVQRGEMGVASTSQVDLRGLPASIYFLREEATGTVVQIAMAGTDAPQ